jgi:outer membrane protein assembly factor BamB
MKRRALILAAVVAIAGLLGWKPTRMAFVKAVGWNIDATMTTSAPPRPAGGTASTAPVEAWRLPMGYQERSRLSEDGAYLAVEETHGIRVYDAVTGRERWHYLDRYMEVDEHGVFVGSGRAAVRLRDAGGSPAVSTLIVFDLASGRRLATHEVSREGYETEHILLPGLVVRAPHIVVLSGRDPSRPHLLPSPVRATRDDGSTAWEWRAACAPGAEAIKAHATVATGRVVVAAECRRLPEGESRYATLTALDRGTGREVWRTRLDEASLVGSPLLGTPRWGDAPLVLFGRGGYPTRVIAVDPATGRRLGGAPLGVHPDIAGVVLSPLPGGWCEAGYGSVRCVDAATGRERWSYGLPGRFRADVGYTDVAVFGGRAAVVGCDTNALDPRCTAAVVDAGDGSAIGGPAVLPGARIGREGVISVEVLGYGPSGLILRTGTLVKRGSSIESPGAVVASYR